MVKEGDSSGSAAYSTDRGVVCKQLPKVEEKYFLAHVALRWGILEWETWSPCEAMFHLKPWNSIFIYIY